MCYIGKAVLRVEDCEQQHTRGLLQLNQGLYAYMTPTDLDCPSGKSVD